MEPFVLVGIGGGIGSIIRFELSKVPAYRGIPLGTMLVNVIGSLVFSLLVFSHTPEDFQYLVGLGGLGGFTTFSTFSYESFRMMENHDYYTMGINILLNVAGSIVGVGVGFLLVG